VAIKVVDKRLFKNSDQKQHAQREQSICEEFAIELKHKNIVEIFDVVSDEECIFIVMEYVQGGELFDRIKQDQKLTEPLARRWFREIVEAVCYIHEVREKTRRNKLMHTHTSG
jgi:serine/threonine protein kinase